VAVVCLILGTPPVLDVVAFTLLALHDPVDAARRAVIAIVVEAMSELSLLAFTVPLVDAADLDARVSARRRCSRLGRRALHLHQRCGDPDVRDGFFGIGRRICLLEMCQCRTQVGLGAVERR
jgi:hypothetical protein